jgi:putative GTP pyrophosphokinase
LKLISNWKIAWKERLLNVPLIQGNVKDFERFNDKMMRKKYPKPDDMTDIARLRVVCYVLSDVPIVSKLIDRTFDVDWENSVDKFKELKKGHRMGYRGNNYVVALETGPEELKQIPFEVQIRTLLDYAWGEIEHDQNYKLAEGFPSDSDIPRRFEALAGAMETLDYAFDSLTKETKQYAKPITNKIRKGELDIPISPISLREFLIWKFGDVSGLRHYFVKPVRVMKDLASMQIHTISDLNNIIPKNFNEILNKVTSPKYDYLTFTLIITEILIAHNSKYYFENIWKRSDYDTLDNHSYKVFEELGLKITLPPGLEYD